MVRSILMDSVYFIRSSRFGRSGGGGGRGGTSLTNVIVLLAGILCRIVRQRIKNNNNNKIGNVFNRKINFDRQSRPPGRR